MTVRRMIQVLGVAAVGVGLAGAAMAAPSEDQVKIAKAIGIVGVKDIEIQTDSNETYWACITCEFRNTGNTDVRMQDIQAEVFFKLPEGAKRRARGPLEGEKQVEVEGTEGSKTVVQRAYRFRDIWPEGKSVRLGNTEKGSTDTLVLKAGTAEAPTKVTKVVKLVIGPAKDRDTTDRVAGLVNVMGDPKLPFEMQVLMTTKAEVGVNGSWIGDGSVTKVDATLKPDNQQEYLFKPSEKR